MKWLPRLFRPDKSFVCPACKAKVATPSLASCPDEGAVVDTLLESYGKHVVHMMQKGQALPVIVAALAASGIDAHRAALFTNTMHADLTRKGVLGKLRGAPLI
jgi:hypothetical protein